MSVSALLRSPPGPNFHFFNIVQIAPGPTPLVLNNHVADFLKDR